MTSPHLNIYTTSLTAEAFAPYGTIITSPIPPSTTIIPTILPPNAVPANQGTAVKIPNVTSLTSTYHLTSSGAPARPSMSLFSCFPRALRPSPNSPKTAIFDVRILERHPYTTQTFIPLYTPHLSNNKAIIIVAPTLPSPPPPSALTPYFPQVKEGGPPDLQNIKAFVVGAGVGVTYGVGTWHAPMVVVGDAKVDWVVSQWVSGREGEDCQEVEIGEDVEIILDVEANVGRSKL